MNDSYLIDYIIFFVGAIIISLIINKLILKYYHALGITDKNDTVVRWSATSKPSLGGISLFATFVVAVIIYAVFYDLGESIFQRIEFFGILMASVLAFGMGASDDYYNTKPLLKLFVQISCGLVFVFTNNGIDIFHNVILDGITTVLWVVAVMNSLNMLDNMDGITGTVSFFILLSSLVLLFMLGNAPTSLWSLLILAEMGALVGFLYFNIHPSKMFMGDAGSQFIALFISFFGIKTLWNLPLSYEAPSWTGIFIVLAAFTPTVVDTLTVMINRSRRGDSMMKGGKDHTTHHLVYKGYSDFGVWIIFSIISLFSFLYALLLGYLVMKGYHYLSVLGLVFFLLVFIPLYRNTHKYPLSKDN